VPFHSTQRRLDMDASAGPSNANSTPDQTAAAGASADTRARSVRALDPSTDGGRWAITTLSGARYLFDFCDATAPTVAGPAYGQTSEGARAHAAPLLVFAVDHVTSDGVRGAGVVVGASMHLVLERYPPLGIADFVRTAPVMLITRLPACVPAARRRSGRF
jgi:hypothetical protein